MKYNNMYSDDIVLEHSSSCICRIPEEWKAQQVPAPMFLEELNL